MPITITSTITGTPDSTDVRAADALIDDENVQRAAADPPGDVLLKSTNAERATSLKEIMDAKWLRSWAGERNKQINVTIPYTTQEMLDLREAAIEAEERGVTATELETAMDATS